MSSQNSYIGLANAENNFNNWMKFLRRKFIALINLEDCCMLIGCHIANATVFGLNASKLNLFQIFCLHVFAKLNS